MSQSAPAAPPTPPAPAATSPSPPFPAVAPAADAGTFAIADGRVVTTPTTAAELRALRARRSELSDQLESATSRRNGLVKRLERTPAGAQDGMRARIALLDQRILQLEHDIDVIGRLVVSAPSGLLASSQTDGFLIFGPNGPSANAVPALLVFVILLQFLVLRRGRRGTPPPDRGSLEASARLARLEQAVDAVAIEVERMSENQRFLTRVLAEERPRAVGEPELATRATPHER